MFHYYRDCLMNAEMKPNDYLTPRDFVCEGPWKGMKEILFYFMEMEVRTEKTDAQLYMLLSRI